MKDRKAMEPAGSADLMTPVYLKTQEDQHWPQDEVFYLLSGDGLFLCRNHPFFVSSVPAPQAPSELTEHAPFLKLRYPKIPQVLMEQAVGFFYEVYLRHRSEAGLLLVWDEERKQVKLVCPEQEALVSKSLFRTFALALKYEIPELDGGLLLGDLHSHACEPAYASQLDQADERGRGAGIHIVVGRLDRVSAGRLPEVHIDAITDRVRFNVPAHMLIEGYRTPRMDFPPEWMEKVKVKGNPPLGADFGSSQDSNAN